ncbi:MAG: acetyl-CoA carboxylase biotin carboxyl carrier protein subunit [Bdellovibrionales bacterium]|nr:acetyl-CoA carboxylase biotin carboxyl carrier protein subunit [Bdellovibrionales bacterium]
MKEWTLEINGKKQKIFVEKLGGKLWYHLNGETGTFQPESKYGSGQSAKANTDPGVIVAPMPGKIIKINCQKGDVVTSGQSLVTMEAMKMEYALEVDIEGTIQEVLFNEGDQVGLGQKIVVVKGSSDGSEKN